MIREKNNLNVSFGPIRKVTIHNLRYEKPYHIYDVRCDRTSSLGNPVGLHGNEDNRNKACIYYDSWFKQVVVTGIDQDAYAELMRIRDIYEEYGRLRIFCWCAPKRCHCQTIRDWLLED